MNLREMLKFEHISGTQDYPAGLGGPTLCVCGGGGSRRAFLLGCMVRGEGGQAGWGGVLLINSSTQHEQGVHY